MPQYPDSLVGLVFMLEYSWYKDSDEVDEKTDKLLALPFVESVDFGSGARPIFIIEVSIQDHRPLLLLSIDRMLREIIGVNPDENPRLENSNG